jgi:hypothetical protein
MQAPDKFQKSRNNNRTMTNNQDIKTKQIPNSKRQTPVKSRSSKPKKTNYKKES